MNQYCLEQTKWGMQGHDLVLSNLLFMQVIFIKVS